MRPDHGGRVELKLSSTSAQSARYALTLFTRDGEVTTLVDVNALTGELELGPWSAATPAAWLVALARALLRSAFRTQSTVGEWPRRVTRWRPQPNE